MKKNILITFLLVFTAGSFYENNLLAEEAAQIVELPGISEENEGIFLSSIKESKPLLLNYPQQTQPQDLQLSDVWKGNRPRILSTVKKLVLEFKNPAIPPVNQQSFSFEFEFSPDALILKHGAAFYSAEAGGFRVASDKNDKNKKFLYRGKNNQSFVIFMPAINPNEKSRGALLCPRDFLPKGSREEKASLQNTGLDLISARAEISSEIVAYLHNPIDFVLAQARIKVTPGVNLPVNFFDQSYSRDSNVSLSYKAQENSSKEFTDFNNIAVGVQNDLVLHLSSGFKRNSVQSSAVYIKKVLIPENLEVALQAKDVLGTEMETELSLRGISLKKQGLISTKVNNGSCYLVLYQVLPIIHQYLKEELIVPAEFLQG